jgi:hypothetical protein
VFVAMLEVFADIFAVFALILVASAVNLVFKSADSKVIKRKLLLYVHVFEG